MEYLRDGERIDEMNTGGLRLIQRSDAFCFGTDSVLLADFAAPRRRDHICDLCSGAGAVSILIAAHLSELGDAPGVSIDQIELDPILADIARRNVEMNRLGSFVRVHQADIRDAGSILGCESMTLCVANPPYWDPGTGPASPRAGMDCARSEKLGSAADVCRAAASLLRQGGRLAMVYPAARASHILRAMEDAGITPKRLLTVHAAPDKAPGRILIEGVKHGGEGIRWLPPLFLRDESGIPTARARQIYREDKL